MKQCLQSHILSNVSIKIMISRIFHKQLFFSTSADKLQESRTYIAKKKKEKKKKKKA